MKKAVTAIAIASVAGSILAGLLVWKRGAEVPQMPVARLVPAETILLAEFPDLPRSASRWPQTALCKLLHEPEVTAFLERPRSRIPKSPVRDETIATFRSAQPRRGFVAVTSITDNMPHVIGGLAYNGKRAEMEALVARARAQAQSASPAGKSELVKYQAFEIESFSDKGVTVAGAFAGDWYFFANDTDLLKAVLDRFTANKAEGTLAGTDVYAKGTAHLPSDPDFAFFVQTSGLVERLLSILSLAGHPVDSQQIAELRKMKAVAGTVRMDGECLRDTIFLLQPGAPTRPLLTRQTLKLTSPDTLLYYAFAPVIPDKMQLPSFPAGAPGQDLNPMAGLLGGLHSVLDDLAKRGISADDFKAALGPEFAIVTDWQKESVQPRLNLAAQVRDAGAARKLAQALCSSWKRDEGDGATFWTMPDGSSPMRASVALTERYLIAGFDIDSLKAAVAKVKAGGDTLEKSALFSGATAAVANPGNTLAYADCKTLFEKAYGSLRPMVMIWAAFVPHVSDYVEVGKLPAPEAIGRHLLPLVLSSSQLENGTLIESTGTITVYQAGAVLAIAGGATAIPVITGKVSIPGLGSFNGANPFGGQMPPILPQASPTPAIPSGPPPPQGGAPSPMGTGSPSAHP